MHYNNVYHDDDDDIHIVLSDTDKLGFPLNLSYKILLLFHNHVWKYSSTFSNVTKKDVFTI